MRWIQSLFVPVFLFAVLFIAACDDGGKEKDKILTFAGSEPVGDFVVIQLNKTDKKVRRINYTNPSDTGWYPYFSVAPTHENAQGFSILKRVDINAEGDYVLFAEFPGTALVYQMFDTSDERSGYPVYVVLREKVDKDEYSEKAYNWIKMKIGGDPADAEMEAGFAAFDTYADGSVTDVGLLYGAGYNSEDDSIGDINSGDIAKISEFEENTELVANTMWTGTPDGMNNAITITGTDSGTNIMDFGPDAGGGMGLAIPQSDVTLADAAGTYFVLCYESDKTTLGSETEDVRPIKVVLSTETGANIKVFSYDADTSVPGDLMLQDTLTALEEIPAGESPGGVTPINQQFLGAAGNGGAVSDVVQNAHLCRGVFVASDETSGEWVITVSIDPLGNFFGFTMLDTAGSNEIVRFGFGIKDDGYANLP